VEQMLVGLDVLNLSGVPAAAVGGTLAVSRRVSQAHSPETPCFSSDARASRAGVPHPTSVQAAPRELPLPSEILDPRAAEWTDLHTFLGARQPAPVIRSWHEDC